MLTLADLTPLEIITYRAALAFQFTDAVTAQWVTDGLTVRAYPYDPAEPGLVRCYDTAEKSPNSNVYGFRTLPGMERYQMGEDLPAGSLSFIITIEDRLGRFLPQTHRYDLPFAAPAVQRIPLFSAPNRATPTGYGAILVQLLRTTAPTPPQIEVTGPAAWARIAVTVPGAPANPYHGFSNSRGSALILAPYPEIPLNVLLNQAQWTVSVSVEIEPAVQQTDNDLLDQVLPGFDVEQTPPFQETLINQAVANLFGTVTIVDAANQIYNVVGATNDTDLDFTLQFGRPLILRTQNNTPPGSPLSELLLEPA